MTVTCDFVVVGGGIAGASAAYELSPHGSVVLVEQEPVPGHHTTGRSAALYTEAYESGPVRLLVMASRGHLESPPEDFSETALLSPLSVMFIARGDQLETLDAIADDVDGIVPIERLSAEAARSVCPALKPGHIAAALLETNSMEIDVHALHQGFLRGAKRRGARIVTNAPVRALTAMESGWSVDAGEDRIEAGVVVDAAGAWCDEVARMAGLRPLGLTPFRRTALAFSPPDGISIADWPMVVDADEQFYFKPERSQIMGSLAEETPMHPHDVHPEEVDVALAIDRINEATTLGIRHVKRTWAGLRTFAPDRRPVVGFDPDAPGFFWLAGQGGYGIMTSPAMSRLAASLITRNRVPDDLAAAGFSASQVTPARFRG